MEDFMKGKLQQLVENGSMNLYQIMERKTSAKLYVPSTAELLKRNIKRSWTISNPSGTGGPPPHHFPPKQDLPIIDESRIATNRPVIVAQIPPPPQRSSRAPGPAPGPSQGPLPG